ncbi:MAG: hypothetical protein AB7J47_23830 [Acidimicrobiia bacterium]
MTTNPLVDEPDREPLAEGGTWLLDLVAAVDHLRRGHRPGLTVWDALEEALRWTVSQHDEDSGWDTADPLAVALRQLLDQSDASVADRIQGAVRRWVVAMASRYNNAQHWPHPPSRRGFPPPSLDVGDDDI